MSPVRCADIDANLLDTLDARKQGHVESRQPVVMED
jgi:hypothetical protein